MNASAPDLFDESILERELSRQTLYDGKILRLDRMTVALPDGREAFREVIVHAGAAAVLPVDENGLCAMIRQYRSAVGRVTLEIPAGKLDGPDEPPQACAARELREETGRSAKSLRPLTAIYPTPGYSGEVIWLYLATGLEKTQGAPDDGEFLSVEWLPLEKLYQMAVNGVIQDSKSVIAILMAKSSLGG